MTVSISKKSASLTIKHAEMSESGKYTCKLKNSVSDVSAEINLTVRGRLEILCITHFSSGKFLKTINYFNNTRKINSNSIEAVRNYTK